MSGEERGQAIHALIELYGAVRPRDGSLPDLGAIDAAAERLWPILYAAAITAEERPVNAAYEALDAFATDKWGTTNPILVPDDDKPLQEAYYRARPPSPL